MTKISEILSETKHRSFDFPAGSWLYYQEWNNALFLHWKVPVDFLRKLVPENLNIDTFDGTAYVSLVAFTMQRIRLKNLPALKFISDFEEINVRTYIDNDNKKGVYFLNIEAEKQLSVIIAKTLSGLPYEKAGIERIDGNCRSVNVSRGFHLDAEFEIKEQYTCKTELDLWLTERYCLYVNKGVKSYRYDIHHKEWEIKDIDLKRLTLNYKIGELNLTDNPDLTHYSEGVKVVAWRKSEL